MPLVYERIRITKRKHMHHRDNIESSTLTEKGKDLNLKPWRCDVKGATQAATSQC